MIRATAPLGVHTARSPRHRCALNIHACKGVMNVVSASPGRGPTYAAPKRSRMALKTGRATHLILPPARLTKDRISSIYYRFTCAHQHYLGTATQRRRRDSPQSVEEALVIPPALVRDGGVAVPLAASHSRPLQRPPPLWVQCPVPESGTGGASGVRIRIRAPCANAGQPSTFTYARLGLAFTHHLKPNQRKGENI
jgi:hypothetical protein